MSKLEEIARAIYADRNGSGCKPWGNIPHSHKTPYLRDALAAVRAMREPTDDMRRAFWDAEDATDTGFKRAWAAAIDSILSEAKQEEG